MDIIVHVLIPLESIVQVNYYYTKTSYSNSFISTDVVNCTNWSVRLVDGESGNEGKVEICIDGIWMTAEANYWSYSSAKIVCRQLGYYDNCKINWLYDSEYFSLLCRVSSYHRYNLEN